MLDGIEMEKRGVRAAVICTDQFPISGRAAAAAQGIPTYPFAIMPHPISNVPEDELSRRALTVADDVVRLLLD